ncbi:MAG TPA: DegT/DnrJ/EryC1/StrS family aminotransferase [Nitrospirae bacterium]|nr:dTDP-3-amino-3,6-dideoxy-alpha-D-galactopyranose transaminase [bacterium BMS3Bbin05]HDH11102.1 DegT/DnrJ/EryC1/StrS family aminotransferase [Nitrospirota bacterium]HDY99923.1 DegT/DnrJ/EryC1/StrS family aminotransferase [Nitrospirota bacterium]
MPKIICNTTIPMLDIKAQHEPIKDEIKTALKDILDSGRFILGQNVLSFEQEVASYHNVSEAVGLASGTDALYLSLRALDIKEGDEVITTPFTFIASAEAITYVGATPVFADIDRNTLNINPAKIEEKITPKTRAIVVVHLFGQPADMDEIMEIAEKRNLKVIEDSAQAFGATYKDAAVGGIGDAGCFSFYPSKNLGAYGDGGMMITNDPEISGKVKLLRNHGATGPYQHSFIGYNSRLDEIQAAILRIKLKHIDAYNRNRRNIAALYTSLLGGAVKCPVEMQDRTHVYHQYTIITPERSKIIKALKDNCISSVVYYPAPLHFQEAFKYLGYEAGDFPESEAAAREVLSIPIYPELDPEKAELIAEIILKALKN